MASSSSNKTQVIKITQIADYQLSIAPPNYPHFQKELTPITWCSIDPVTKAWTDPMPGFLKAGETLSYTPGRAAYVILSESSDIAYPESGGEVVRKCLWVWTQIQTTKRRRGSEEEAEVVNKKRKLTEYFRPISGTVVDKMRLVAPSQVCPVSAPRQERQAWSAPPPIVIQPELPDRGPATCCPASPEPSIKSEPGVEETADKRPSSSPPAFDDAPLHRLAVEVTSMRAHDQAVLEQIARETVAGQPPSCRLCVERNGAVTVEAFLTYRWMSMGRVSLGQRNYVRQAIEAQEIKYVKLDRVKYRFFPSKGFCGKVVISKIGHAWDAGAVMKSCTW